MLHSSHCRFLGTLALATRSCDHAFSPNAGHRHQTLQPIDATREEQSGACLRERWFCKAIEDMQTCSDTVPTGVSLTSLRARTAADGRWLAAAVALVLHGQLVSPSSHHHCPLRPVVSGTGPGGDRRYDRRDGMRMHPVRMQLDEERASYGAAANFNDPRNRPGWSAKYRKLLPFDRARKTVRSIGFSSKADWDEWVAEGKSLPWLGPYMPSRPDLMYEDEWRGWGDFLGTMLPFEQARMVARQLGIRGQSAWWELVESRPEFVADLRIPARPHLVYSESWCGYDDWLGLEETTLYAPAQRAEEDDS